MKAVLFTKPFSKDSLPELASRVRDMGFQGVEYPFRPGYQVDLERAPEGIPSLVEAMEAEGLEVTVATANFDQYDSPVVEGFYKAVGYAGIPFIRPSYYPVRGFSFWKGLEEARRKIRSLAALSAEYGPKTLLHNHYGQLFTCSCLAARMLAESCDPQHVGIYVDFAHLSLNGEPFEMALGICGEYFSLVGVKANRYVPLEPDEHRQLCYAIEWVPLAQGITDWPSVVKSLRRVNYDGPYVFHAEYTAHERTAELIVEDRTFLARIVDVT